jgi:MoaA/NifB/PqqE/SkfB family radical SAM enzyme
MRASHGWAHIDSQRKRDIIDAIVSGKATRGPVHAELDLTDRCNVDCYFCNQMDVRTKEQVPLPHAIRIIDELAAGGLKSVRLSGGGDPLFHREILQILDHLAAKNITVDNLTTNGVGLTPAVAERLVNNKAREVIISLNTVDAVDYHRMMQVKPELFDTVLNNIRHLLAVRGDAEGPGVIVQFMLDRHTFLRLEEMYQLGRQLGVDRIAINQVLEIPRQRINRAILLGPEDAAAARPYVRKILEADRDRNLLLIDFPLWAWNAMIADVRRELGVDRPNDITTAPSFREENGQCFFAWYTTTIRGNGEMYPCCLLQTPDYKPLGNAVTGSVESQWNGPGFTKLREEMRDVMLTGGDIVYSTNRFQAIRQPCVQKDLCWLKNMYFRADEDFYRELGEALAVERKKEIRWFGRPAQIKRAADMFRYRHVPLQNMSADIRRFYRRVRSRLGSIKRKVVASPQRTFKSLSEQTPKEFSYLDRISTH